MPFDVKRRNLTQAFPAERVCQWSQTLSIGADRMRLLIRNGPGRKLLSCLIKRKVLGLLPIAMIAAQNFHANLPRDVECTLPSDLAPLNWSRSCGRVGPKGGPHATFASYRRTDPWQIA